MSEHQLSIKDLDPRIIMKARDSPVFFAEKILGITPYYYQAEIMDDKHPYKIMVFGRQMGKSQMLAMCAVHKAVMYPKSRIAVLAQNEKRAFEVYRLIKTLIKSSPILESVIDPRKDKMSETELRNGSRISFYASGNEGKAIRGDTLDMLIMDEGDFIADAVYMAALPTVSATGGEIWLSSTPNKKYTMFYNIFMDAWEAKLKFEGKKEYAEGELPYEKPVGQKFGFKAWHYDYQHGLAVTNPRTKKPQTDIRLVELAKKTDITFYEREYLAIWSDDTASFLPEGTIVSSLVSEKTLLAPPKFRVMGLDLGRIHDYTALVILELTEDMRNALVIDTYRVRKNDWNYILDQVLEYAFRHDVLEIHFDANNVGDVIHTWLSNEGDRVMAAFIPHKLSLQSKTVLYNNLKMALNSRRLKIRIDQTDLINELRQLTAVQSDTNRGIKIHAPSGKFDDLADALALACSALKMVMDDEADMRVIYKQEPRDWNYDDTDDEDVMVVETAWGGEIELEEVEPLFDF